MATHFTRGKYREEEHVIASSLHEIERAYEILLALPESDSARFFRLEDHQDAVLSNDPQRGCLMLFLDAFNWLKFFWFTSIYKTRQLTAALIHSYNTENFLSWVILARSTVEYAAISYYFVNKISELQLKGPNFAASHLRRMEDALLQYAHGTRFSWPDLFAGNREELTKNYKPLEAVSAVNVLTAMKHLARRDERYKDIEVAYAMLSDFAHPNMASHAAVVEMPTEPCQMHECQLAAHPGALRGEFLMVLSLPWVSTGICTTVELLIELAPLVETWLNYIEQGIPTAIDFTK